MAFRADEAALAGYSEAEDYLVNRLKGISDDARRASQAALRTIVDELGPAIDTYPTWHPLVVNHDDMEPVTTPDRECGYEGLDHTTHFLNGFVSCPYGDGADEIIASVKRLPPHPVARIVAEKIDAQFYSTDATPVLVKCVWDSKKFRGQGPIPLAVAMPLMLQKEIPAWEWAQVAETWETMRHYLLGGPRGARSSLFVTQETGQAMKKLWESLIFTGMFGPIKVRPTKN